MFMQHSSLLLALMISISLSSLYAQEPGQEKETYPIYQEQPDDPYLPPVRTGQWTSPPYQYTSAEIWTVQVNVEETGMNILNDAANEPSIAVDPTNPNRIVIGWRQFDNINSNFRQAGQAYSDDGGNSWTAPEVIDPGVFRSDPVLDFDREGTFYYNSLTVVDGDYVCDVFPSTGYNDWGEGVYAYGGDKQWMVVDRTDGPSQGNIYAQWKSYLSACPPGDFTRSLDGGISFDACSPVTGSPQRGTLSVGPDGTVYAFGQVNSGFLFAKSTNAKEPDITPTWTASAVDLNGAIGLYQGPNPGGMLAQAWVATDHSNTGTHGNVYVVCSVFPDNPSDPLDVMFASSTDGGQSWTAPLRINDDPLGNWQWFGTISVAPNGRIDVAWLDTRNDPGGYASALFYSFSEDGGQSWSPNEQLSETFDPHLGWPNQEKIGDYMHMISTDEGVHLAWAATFNGEQDIYYSFITPDVMSATHNPPETSNTFIITPNPFRKATRLEYTLREKAFVQLYIYDTKGQQVLQVFEGTREAGSHREMLSGLSIPGIYYGQLIIDGQLSHTEKLVVY
jgi:hypothetical protein